MTAASNVEDLLRELTPQVLGAVARRYGNIDDSEDAVQEALLAAARHWPAEGVPDAPLGWLITVASRRMTDRLRNEKARRRRERVATSREPADAPPVPDRDDSLTLLILCCHPALSPASAIPLTLRAVGGLTTAEIARAFLVPEATMAQRISRAKQRIKESGAHFEMPAGAELAERLRSVLHGAHRGVVDLGEAANDREPEPRPRPAGGRRPSHERLEDAFVLVGRQTRAAVEYTRLAERRADHPLAIRRTTNVALRLAARRGTIRSGGSTPTRRSRQHDRDRPSHEEDGEGTRCSGR